MRGRSDSGTPLTTIGYNKHMNQKILDFITNHRVCSLTTILPDGSPHSAAMHYSHSVDPLTFYFSSDNESKKFQGLVKNNTGKASMIIGFSEEEWLTLQYKWMVKFK